MNKFIRILLLLGCAFVAFGASADDAAIKKTINSFIPNTPIDQITPSEVSGLYEVRIGTNILYVSEDGKYLLQGQLYDANAKKNLTETKLADARKTALDKIGTDKMIVFKPVTSKYVISVFTDIDCGYCRKLHSEIDQYLDKGITVRYLFFPRAGKGSDSYKKAVSVWCAADRNKALTTAKKSEQLDNKTCENPIDEQMQLAEDFGMNGTPLIVTGKGNLLPGYVPAEKLADILSKE
jgi:thiol:disulfide interchange protein DsbC